MSITDELREWVIENTTNNVFTCYPLKHEVCGTKESLLDIADRIDGVHDHAVMSAMNDALYHANDKNMAELGWVRLPKDADGVPIHARDVLDGYGKTIEVVEMRYGRSGWVIVSRDGNAYADCAAFTHHHTPTVEDVLREFAEGLGVTVADSYIATSAAKLRLAEGEDA